MLTLGPQTLLQLPLGMDTHKPANLPFHNKNGAGRGGTALPRGLFAEGFRCCVSEPRKWFQPQWRPAPLCSQTDNSTFRVASFGRIKEKVWGEGMPSETGKNFQQVHSFWPWQYKMGWGTRVDRMGWGGLRRKQRASLSSGLCSL